jgi:predicted outer membrane repeat protein
MLVNFTDMHLNYNIMKKLLSFIILLLFTAINISAKTITVTSNADSGEGTLRQAVTDANNGDVIVFAEDITSVTVSNVIQIRKSITINGNSNNNTTIIAAANPYIFNMVGDITLNVAMNNLTIKDWRYYSTCAGVILKNDDGTLTLTNCSFIDNIAPSSSGAAISSTKGSVILDNCFFKGNQGKDGGAIYSGRDAKTFVSDCAFVENKAKFGIILNYGYVEINNCIFKKNLVDDGVIRNVNDLLSNMKGSAFVKNSLFEENISLYDTFTNQGNAEIVQCLFVKNTNNSIATVDNLYYCGTYLITEMVI